MMNALLTKPSRLHLLLLLLSATLCALVVGRASADDTLAGVADVSQPISDLWIGSIPTGAFAAVSTDTVLPLPLQRLANGTLSDADALAYISVEVRPKDAPEADPTPGSLTYHSDLGLVLWAPDAPLDPLTTYAVTVVADNAALTAGSPFPHDNIAGAFEVTTADGILEALDPSVLSFTVGYREEQAFVYCPDGEQICADPDDATTCTPGAPYLRTLAEVSLAYTDGEADGQDLFFAHTAHDTTLNTVFSTNTGPRVTDSEHSGSFFVSGDYTEACIRLESIDLRALARGDAASGTRTLTDCLPLEGLAPPPDLSDELEACAPGPVIIGEDTGTNGDTSSPNGDTSGGDASGGDVSASDPGDESGCGCTTTRAPQGQPPVGLLLGLAATFGAGAVLRRRRASR